MEEAIRRSITAGDFLRLKGSTPSTTPDAVIVEVLSAAEETVYCRIYTPMTGEILNQFSLQPIMASLFPVAGQSNIVELVGTVHTISAQRSDIIDIAYIVPIQELESGMVHITGASNLFFARYGFSEKDKLFQFPSSLYFAIQYIYPFSFRIFSSLNMLALNLKKSLFHTPESQEPKKVFRVSFSAEAFHYMSLRIGILSSVQTTVQRCQRIVKYYDTLKTESGSRVNNLAYLRILTSSALNSLRSVIGFGIGIGAAGVRPSKARPLQYCTIGSLLSSVECPTDIPAEILRKPTTRVECNGIDFIYTHETQTLMCTVRFSKIPVVTADVATSRIAAALVSAGAGGAYVGACFHYREEMFEVVAIHEQLCRCLSLEHDNKTMDLNLDLVNNLVNSFGT
jgi:hypothetical protein